MSLAAALDRWLPEVWRRRGVAARLLLPLAALFGAVTQLRALAFRRGFLKSASVGVPVIVVGNITVGGSGKTPLVLWLVDALRACGRRPGVISRGYGRSVDGVREVTVDSTADEVGDEPLLIARRAGCPVFVGRDRVAAARALRSKHADCDVIVSDDGLQHYRLERDIELVVFDERGAGNGWLLPAGPLREPVSRLRRVDAVIANGRLPVALQLRLGDRPLYAMALRGDRLTRLGDAHIAGVDVLGGRRIHALAGIGNPQRFFDRLSALGLSFETHVFPDHHRFEPADLALDGAQAILMTEKDAVKCAPFASRVPCEMWALRVDASLEPDLLPLIERKLERLPENPHGSATA